MTLRTQQWRSGSTDILDGVAANAAEADRTIEWVLGEGGSDEADKYLLSLACQFTYATGTGYAVAWYASADGTNYERLQKENQATGELTDYGWNGTQAGFSHTLLSTGWQKIKAILSITGGGASDFMSAQSNVVDLG